MCLSGGALMRADAFVVLSLEHKAHVVINLAIDD